MCDEDGPKAKIKEKMKNCEKLAVLFLGKDTADSSLLKGYEEKCLGFISCYQAKLLEWLLNLDEKVVSRKVIGLSVHSQGHEVEEATEDKHVQAGKTEKSRSLCC